jgi:hypothetical protein
MSQQSTNQAVPEYMQEVLLPDPISMAASQSVDYNYFLTFNCRWNRPKGLTPEV